jgi:hypothetical protein
MTRRILVFLLACALSLVCTASARADLLTTMIKDYTQDGRLDPCKYSEKQLRDLKDLIPNDFQQYADFDDAVDDALAKRAQGACNKGAGAPQGGTAAPPASTGTPPPPATKGAPTPTPLPTAAQPPPMPGAAPTAAPAVAADNAIGTAARATEPATDAPFPLLALAVLAGLLAIGTLAFGLARWRAWEPAWADRFRHAAGEAGWRASSTWAEFTDFVRFGR